MATNEQVCKNEKNTSLQNQRTNLKMNIQVCKRNKSANKNQGEFQTSDQIQSKWPKSFQLEYLHHYTAQKT
jgi:hypothetical protein